MEDMSTKKDPQEYNVRAIERALQVLDCFDEEHPVRGVSEIAQTVGLHKATTHRIVTTLFNYGYLERASDGKKYRLGIQLATMGSRVVNRMDLRGEARPYMNELVMQWDEACDLCIFDQGSVFYIEVLRDHHALRISSAVGQTLPAYCTASGKVFLAFLPPAELDSMINQPLAAYTENTITSSTELRKQFEEVRKRGYAFDDEEYELGIRAIAAPIFNRKGRVTAVLGIPGPVERMSLDRIPQMVESLISATQSISHRLGWRG